MRIAVVGAGAIGGLVGGRLALAGEQVTLVDVGPHLEAIRRDGLRILGTDGSEDRIADLPATADPEEAGEHDLVILALKAYDIAPVASRLPSLLGPKTPILHLQNGLPWWYFQRHGGRFEGRPIESLDPEGRIRDAVDPGRILGCVVYPASELSAPGVVRHVEGRRFPLGELDGTLSARAAHVSDLLNRAGFKSYVLEDIRSEIWLKLWGNMSFNPVSALTHATMEEMCRYPPSRALIVNLMTETQAVAERLGVGFRVPMEQRIAGAERVGAHKTSTLQDVEAGRRLELEALLGALLEVARIVEVPMPHAETLYACCALLEENIARRGGGVRIVAPDG